MKLVWLIASVVAHISLSTLLEHGRNGLGVVATESDHFGTADAGEIRPFQIHVTDDQIADLHKRLDLYIPPQKVARKGIRNELGIEGEDLDAVIHHWRHAFDWRQIESKLNAIPQFSTVIDGVRLHFLYVRADRSKYAESDIVPLMLVHGWPQTNFDYQYMIPLLTDPLAHSGSAKDAFDVVVPSMPGYGFSGQPINPRTGAKEVAVLYSKLMARLNCSRYIINGGDWGSIIAPEVAAYEERVQSSQQQKQPPHLLGLHVNGVIAVPPGADFNPFGIMKGIAHFLFPSYFYNAYELRKLQFMKKIPTEASYFLQQMTKPQTLGVGLQNSPVALAAWLVEKFVTWTDSSHSSNDPTKRAETLDDKMNLSLHSLKHSIPLEDMLTICSIYWFTGTITSSVMMYHNTVDPDTALKQLQDIKVHTPTGIADFPVDVIWSPLPWASNTYKNVIHYHQFQAGGHFATLEEPVNFSSDLRKFKAAVLKYHREHKTFGNEL